MLITGNIKVHYPSKIFFLRVGTRKDENSNYSEKESCHLVILILKRACPKGAGSTRYLFYFDDFSSRSISLMNCEVLQRIDNFWSNSLVLIIYSTLNQTISAFSDIVCTK